MKCWIFLGLFAPRINKENTNFTRSKELPHSPTRLVKNTNFLESEFVSFRLETHNWIPFHLRIDIQLRYMIQYILLVCTLLFYLKMMRVIYTFLLNVVSRIFDYPINVILQFICFRDDIILHSSYFRSTHHHTVF